MSRTLFYRRCISYLTFARASFAGRSYSLSVLVFLFFFIIAGLIRSSFKRMARFVL